MKLDGVMVWVQDVPATVAFYEAAFGLGVEMMHESQQFAMLSTGETTLQFADERAADVTGVAIRGHRPAETAAAFQLAFVVEDVHAAYARVVAAGATPEVALVEKPWGQTVGYLRDLNGCLVELASPSAW